MKARILVLVILAAMNIAYRGTVIYTRYFVPDLQTQLPFDISLSGADLTVKKIDYEKPPFKGVDKSTLPATGDHVLEIYPLPGRGGPVRSLFEFGELLAAVGPVHSWTMVVERPRPDGAPGAKLTFSIPPAVPIVRTPAQSIAQLGFDVYLPFLAMITGLFVGFAKPRDNLAFLAALVFLGFSTWFRQNVLQFPPLWRDLGLVLRALAVGLAPYLILHFFLLFPARSSIDRRLPWLRPAALVTSVLLCALVLVLDVTAHKSFAAHAAIIDALAAIGADAGLVAKISGAFNGLTITVAMIALGLHVAAQKGRDERRRAVILFAGLCAAAVPLGALFVADTVKEVPAWLLAVSVPLIGLFPLSFAYAVVKHRVFGIRVIVRRGLQYALLSRGFLLVEAVLIFAALYFAAGPLFGQIAPAAGPSLATIGTAAATIGLLIGMRRVNRRVMPAIDRRFFRDAYDARRVLTDLSRAVRRMASRPDRLLDRMVDELCAALHPQRVAVFLHDVSWPHLRAESDASIDFVMDAPGAEPLRFRLYREASGPDATTSEPKPGVLDGRVPLATFLAQSAKGDAEVLSVFPLDWAGGRDTTIPHGTVTDRALYAHFDARLVVPLATAGRVLGFVVLGEKRSEEPYSREDAELLLSVAEQVAIALDYSHLIDRVAEQEGLRREMEIAQQVQARLFPHDTPELRTLQYAGLCRAARGVGGDYYDFLPLGGERLGIAVADIAGKGLPAALLMASLQALLRSHAPTHVGDLGELGRELNRHLCDVTTEGRYATLFFGVYDDTDRTLRYLNCGHQPPVLVRRREGAPPQVRRLPPCGMVLGLFDDQRYEAGKVQLEPGELIVVFSDGVTEACDEVGEFFGEDRLVDLVLRNADLPGDRLARTILEAVDGFVGPHPQQDDITVITAQVASVAVSASAA